MFTNEYYLMKLGSEVHKDECCCYREGINAGKCSQVGIEIR